MNEVETFPLDGTGTTNSATLLAWEGEAIGSPKTLIEIGMRKEVDDRIEQEEESA